MLSVEPFPADPIAPECNPQYRGREIPGKSRCRCSRSLATPPPKSRSFCQLASEAQDLADEKQFVLVYDTFSRRLVDALENQGFSTGYQRQLPGYPLHPNPNDL